MIQKITMPHTTSFKASEATEKKASKFHDYADSFVKHSAKSAPTLLAFTGVWSMIDNKVGKIPFKKSLAANLTNFFVPVLVLSSAVLSIVENKDNKKQS